MIFGLSEGESFIQEFEDSVIIFKPAMLPGEEVGGFISVLWSKHQIKKLEWELRDKLIELEKEFIESILENESLQKLISCQYFLIVHTNP